MKYGILFIFRLLYEYIHLEYVHIHVIYRVNQAEYDIRVLVAESQKYVNTFSTRRPPTHMQSLRTQRPATRGCPSLCLG